jgi:hypothetical protein
LLDERPVQPTPALLTRRSTVMPVSKEGHERWDGVGNRQVERENGHVRRDRPSHWTARTSVRAAGDENELARRARNA